MEQTYYAEVSVAAHGGLQDFCFTYQSASPLRIGQLVKVPFGRRASLGVVCAQATKPAFDTKVVSEVLPLELPAHLPVLGRWLHDYYIASPQAVWQTLLPAGIGKKRHGRNASTKLAAAPAQHRLTAEQTAALTAFRDEPHRAFLLNGITGSGKTQLYIERSRDALASGKSVIILVPEIALAPQLVRNFEDHFPGQVIAHHSKMTEATRYAAWQAALESNGPHIVIGPRSALFMPLASIGLIVIDEEHETSYKQEQNPRYETVIAAGQLAKLTEAQLLLGSATPALREVYLAQINRLGLAKLTKRIRQQSLPQTNIIDLRDKAVLKRSRFLSEPLLVALEETLAAGRQSLLFMNRRGSASSHLCADCGYVSQCPRCHIPLTFHADQMKLRCHYCDFAVTPPAACPDCGSPNLRYIGGGTKRIEAEVSRLFPEAKLARMDRDSATPASIDDMYDKLATNRLDILIGTQMIAKGIHAENIDLVGVVSADTMLHIPDFSAAERTFQLISQVIGRAGRGTNPGRAIIQTYTPEHPAITGALAGSFESFAEHELAARRLLAYPPFVYLLKLSCSLASQAAALKKATALADSLQHVSAITLLGPAPAFSERVGGKYTWQLIIKSKTRGLLTEIAKTVPSGWTIDLDPGNVL